MIKKNTQYDAPSFVEINGEVLPYYSGETNGPRNSSGALMEEIDDFLYPDDSADAPEPTTSDLVPGSREHFLARVRELAQDLGEKSLVSSNDLVRRSEELTDQRRADRMGTHPGTSPVPSTAPRPYIAGKKHGETRYQRAARQHVVNARRQRWGR